MRFLIALVLVFGWSLAFGETTPKKLLEVTGTDQPVSMMMTTGITLGTPGDAFAMIDLKNRTVVTSGDWDAAGQLFWMAVEQQMPEIKFVKPELEEPCIFDAETGAEDCPIEQEPVLECEPVPCVDTWRDLLIGLVAGVGFSLMGMMFAVVWRRSRR